MSKNEGLRNSFLRMRGGKLISIESIVLAFVVFFVLAVVKDVPQFAALVAAVAVGFVFPILVGLFKSIAWVAAILFSLIWAFVAYFLAENMANGSVGFLAGVIIFVISFMVHKNYSGLSFHGVGQKKLDQKTVSADHIKAQERVSFCPKCGRRIRGLDGRCEVCDK